jgi:hypothetical protein
MNRVYVASVYAVCTKCPMLKTEERAGSSRDAHNSLVTE